jgi:hypothetical protein
VRRVSGREKVLAYYGLVAACIVVSLSLLVIHLFLDRPVSKGVIMPLGMGLVATVHAFRQSHPLYFAKTLQLRVTTGVAASLMLVDFFFSLKG